MIIVMKADVLPGSPEVAAVVESAGRYPDVHTEVRAIQGATRVLTEIYLLGSTAAVPADPFLAFAGVEKVIRIRERYRAIGRHDGAEGFGFEYNGVKFSQDSFHLFPGLCAVDTRQNVERVFRALQQAGIETTRAGAYKPRTSPYDFQGHGKACLPYVFELAGKYGLRVISMEITHESHVDEIQHALRQSGDATGVMLQIGTRNAQNFELLKIVGQQSEFPVLFKRGMGITLEESLNACEYVASSGNHKIVF
jgi:3-deoxy-7-phosphoheptulonate synthase